MRLDYVYLSPCLPQNSTQPIVAAAAAVNTPATASINNTNTTFPSIDP